MGYFIVTIVSPTGFRDTFGVKAYSHILARENVRAQIIMTHVNWKVVSAMRVS